MENKKILLASLELSSVTGQPMYTYNLAKGLVEAGHTVVCVGLHIEGSVTDMIRELGCVVTSINTNKWKGKYDVAMIGERIPEYLDGIESKHIFNICHSKDNADEPIIDDRITRYIAPREQVSEYWQKKHDIKFDILPIPIDFDKFKAEHKQSEFYTILAPCSRGDLRKPMLLDLIERSKEPNVQVVMVGNDYGGLKGVQIPSNVKVYTATTNLLPFYQVADEVAGIFIGTITLEAWAMNIETSVYDEKGNWDYVDKPKDLDKHNYKNVTKQFLNLIKYEV